MKLKRRIAYQTQISYIFRSFLFRNCRESCKRAQLSYSNLLSAQKRVSTKIVNEICQPDIERSTSKPNGTYRQPIHGCCHKPKNMFHPTTNFGFSAVILFLFFGQGGVAITFFTNFISDVFGEFLSCISTVGITYFIFFIEKHFKFIAFVYVGRRYCIIPNQLAFSINLNMILVTVMCFIFSCPFLLLSPLYHILLFIAIVGEFLEVP